MKNEFAELVGGVNFDRAFCRVCLVGKEREVKRVDKKKISIWLYLQGRALCLALFFYTFDTYTLYTAKQTKIMLDVMTSWW